MSADGRFVAFDSALSNLVEGDINRDSDVFVRDMVSGVTELVSVSSTGVQGLGASERPRISADGRYVAFQSDSSNLVAGDTNGTTDVFVHDRQTGKTERVSVTTGGAQAVGGWSDNPAISADGRYVAFATFARNIVPAGASNLCEEIVVHDRITGVTEHASPAAGGGASNGICTYGSFLDLSADGRFVTFETQMDDLVPDDHNASWDIFVRDLQQKTTRRVSVASDGSEANHSSYNPRISADGRFVAFTSCASNLVPEDNNSSGLKAASILGTGSCFDVFVHDLLTGATERVSVSSSGREGDWGSYWMDISGDGRFVAFSSSATTLAPGASDSASRVFVHDRRTRQTEIVSVRDDGTVFGNSAYFSPPAISSDGRYVAFSKPVDFSIAGRYEKMVYVRDRGPAIGVGGLTAAVLTDTPPSVSGSGWAGLGGTTVTEATDPPDDVSPPEAARIGGELTGAALVYRPEEEDLLVRFSLAHIPTSSSSVVGSGYGVPGIAGSAGILHTLFFTVDGQRWEVRASRVNVDEPGYPPPPSISLWKCAPSCQETMHMNGAYGSTGAEIVGRFTLANISAAEGAAVTSVRAAAAVGDLVLDEVQLPAGTIPVSEVRLALAPAGSEPTGYGPKLAPSSGSFSGSVSAEDLPPGVYELWARACVGAACDVRSTNVTLGSPGDPTPPPISPWPSASPTISPAPSASPTDAGSARGTYPTKPDDPYFDSPEDFLFGLAQSGIQWGPQKINAPQAWQEDQATGDRVKVAVLDTGVDLTHPDLTCPGKLEVVAGSDVVDNDSNPDDEFGHGTHVAGIIGACTNNAVGIAGVAPDAAIMPIRVLDDSGSGTDAQLIAGLDKAVEFGAHVINMSLGYPPGKDIVNDVSAIDAAIARARAAGIVIVAAAGNDSSPLCDYPALADDIICVGATDPRDLKSWYSTFPNKIDNDNDIGPGVVAPGGAGTVFCDLDSEEILSLYAVDIDKAEGDCDGRLGYTDLAGTSMAAPHVAGIAALVYDRLGADRSPTNATKVITALESTAVDLGSPGYDPVYGSGRVDALAAVRSVSASEGPDPDPSESPSETSSPTSSPSPTVTSSPTDEPTTGPGPGTPEAPSNLTARAASSSRIELAWVDNSTSESGFAIERSSDGDTWREIGTAGRDQTMYLHMGLDPDTSYSYRVRALNPSGYSPYSNTASATTMSEQSQDATTQAPAAPSNLKATSSSPARIELTWSDNSTTQDGFAIERSTDAATWQEIATTGRNQTTYLDTGLAANTTYQYRVRAYNSAGHSAYSNVVSAKTQQAPANGGGGGGGEPSPSPSQSSATPVAPSLIGIATTSIAASRSITTYNEGFELSGVVERDDNCTGPLEVMVSRRIHGTDAYEAVASTPVNGAGAWGLQVVGTRNASYIAQVEKTDTCQGDISVPTDVLVKAKISVRVPAACGGIVRGKVLPAYEDSRVSLQRRAKGRWVDVTTDALDSESRFALRAKRCGLHRITWSEDGGTNEPARQRFWL